MASATAERSLPYALQSSMRASSTHEHPMPNTGCVGGLRVSGIRNQGYLNDQTVAREQHITAPLFQDPLYDAGHIGKPRVATEAVWQGLRLHLPCGVDFGLQCCEA